MDIFSASQARANLFKLLEQVNQDSKPRIITSRRGDGVLISKDDWESIQETLYLQSIPGMRESIAEGMNTPLSECVSEEELEW
ncbi:MAG: type II toxin-antitoxin system Phd/YefM family antitoxin [Pleurocapsa minor HA4230-MV1]|jgi:antitoxin YefM|nr:type II toxin-antitoxin system Phd/YefM family antitoxin [Pleurocapsa minor HA4230-MV1]